MTYFNQYHKENSEACMKQIQEWRKSPMFSDEKQLLAYMMRNYNLALELTEAASGKSKEFYSKAH